MMGAESLEGGDDWKQVLIQKSSKRVCRKWTEGPLFQERKGKYLKKTQRKKTKTSKTGMGKVRNVGLVSHTLKTTWSQNWPFCFFTLLVVRVLHIKILLFVYFIFLPLLILMSALWPLTADVDCYSDKSQNVTQLFNGCVVKIPCSITVFLGGSKHLWPEVQKWLCSVWVGQVVTPLLHWSA